MRGELVCWVWQSQKEGLQRKVAERTAELRSKQQQLAAVAQVRLQPSPLP